MNEALMKMAEGYEMIAAGTRQMVSEGRGLPEGTGKAPEKKEAAETVSPKEMAKDEPQIDRKTVRAFLTEKSRTGKTSEVKNLIIEFGYSKLSDVPDGKLGALMGAHARFSPSSGRRYLSCPPSLKLEEQFADEQSPYAAEGTAGHKMAEYLIKKHLKKRTKWPVSDYYSGELMEAVEDYAGRNNGLY